MLAVMAYYLGLDAGGTKTECALARDETILARATGGPIKILRVPKEEAEKNLDALLETICEQSGISLQSIDRTCIGLAGISVPRIADWTRQALENRISGEIVLAGDEAIALDAAFGDGAGVLVVAGTGSNIIGRTFAGQLVHVGGWGPVLADEGSGNWIGRQAVRAIFDALDHDETTPLLPEVQTQWNLPNVGSLIDLSNQLPGPNFSALTPLVAKCAKQRDPYAKRVLEQAGTLLGGYALLAVRRLQKLERKDRGLPEIAYCGGIVEHIGSVTDAMCAAIVRELPQARIRTEAADPLQGALWRARHSSGAGGGQVIRFPRR